MDYSSSGHQEKQSSPYGRSFVTIGCPLLPVLGLQASTACRRGRVRDVSCAYRSAFISCVDFSRLSLPPPACNSATGKRDGKSAKQAPKPTPSSLPFPFPSLAAPQERLPLVRIEWQFFKNMARAMIQIWSATRRAIRRTRSEPLVVTRNGPSTAAPTGPGRRLRGSSLCFSLTRLYHSAVSVE